MGLKPVLTYGLRALATLIALALLAVAWWFATFDAAAYKARLSAWVLAQGGYRLEISGDLHPVLWPWPGLHVGQARLYPPEGIAPLASARSVSVSLAIWPLLRGQAGVGKVVIDGLDLDLGAGADRPADAAGRSEPGARPGARQDTVVQTPREPVPLDAGKPIADGLPFEIGGLVLHNATIHYADGTGRYDLTWDRFDLHIGRLAEGETTPVALDGHLQTAAGRADLMVRLDAQLTPGSTPRGVKLDRLRWHLEGTAMELASLSADLNLDSLQLGTDAVTLQGLVLDAHLRRAMVHPPEVDLHLRGQAGADLKQQTVQWMLGGMVDETTVNMHGQLQGFASPALRVNLNLGALDLDRYLAMVPPVEPVADLSAKQAVAPPIPPATAASLHDQPVDLTALFHHDLQATLRVAELRAWQVRVTSLRMDARVLDTQADLKPVTAVLYDGGVNGSVSVKAGDPDATAQAQQFHARLDLRGVHVAPLLQDLLGQQPLEGRGNVALDLRATGGSTDAIKRSLDGTVGVQLTDGAIRGFDVNGALRDLQHRISGIPLPPGNARPKTDFSEFQASLRIRQGVASNDDLSAKTPLLRLAGHGVIDLVQETLDYDLQALLATTLEGQGGADLGQLKGWSIPLHIGGPFGAIRLQLGASSGPGGIRR